MGSWDATCAVSRLAIKSGDEVFWIYSTEKHVKTTYDIMQSIGYELRRTQQQEESRKRDEEFLLKFPEASEEIKTLFSWPHIESEYRWGFGQYDDYGGVEDVDIPEEFSNSLILIRKSVADKMAEFGKTKMKREWADNPEMYEKSYPYCVVLVAWLTRINLFGYILLGRQSRDLDEFKEMFKVQRIILQEMWKTYREELASTGEYNWWSFRVGLLYEIKRWYEIKRLLKKRKK